MEYPQLKLERLMCHRLYTASNSIIEHYREAVMKLDLTYPQFIVMMALWEKDQLTITELLDKTAIDRDVMTKILQAMINKCLICTTTTQDAKQQQVIKLNERGSKLKHEAASVPKKVQTLYPHMTEEEVRQLMILLDKMNQRPCPSL